LDSAFQNGIHLEEHSDFSETAYSREAKTMTEDPVMSAREQASSDTGVMKAIAWLREMGRPILGDKVER
jgi:hypothetical protein